ncbi:DEAD/DEAH box helicase, partial [Stomatohabitans albus]|uniref:DEAD/DEAH box helicase n=1 Tax=Stomatohabitans albus TaxID=3110766 RepID=UPI00300D50E8
IRAAHVYPIVDAVRLGDLTGMFKGPYVRLRLPFQPATPDTIPPLAWESGLTPYSHQARAFARLVSSTYGQPRNPLPTLVTTGTGSGKTEAFLYPILDHVLRAKRQGINGVKALILYPMNALANDQAGRLAKLITSNNQLNTVRAGIYTGQEGPTRTMVSAEGLITDRYEMRDNPPDILLTNYKMLDQLLLRAEDQVIWQASAASLRYLVLDEFHTYDGAQGTDVAILLRRLGFTIKAFYPGQLSQADQARPLGQITPVATSATLGEDDPTQMLTFAETVFGEDFPNDAIITESRLSVEDWVGQAPSWRAQQGIGATWPNQVDVLATQIRSLGANPAIDILLNLIVDALFENIKDKTLLNDHHWVERLLKSHPLVRRLVDIANKPVSLDDLPARVREAGSEDGLVITGNERDWATVLNAVIAILGHIRAHVGREALSVEVHYWLREVSRVDRTADSAASFRWSDDGPASADDAPTAQVLHDLGIK